MGRWPPASPQTLKFASHARQLHSLVDCQVPGSVCSEVITINPASNSFFGSYRLEPAYIEHRHFSDKATKSFLSACSNAIELDRSPPPRSTDLIADLAGNTSTAIRRNTSRSERRTISQHPAQISCGIFERSRADISCKFICLFLTAARLDSKQKRQPGGRLFFSSWYKDYSSSYASIGGQVQTRFRSP